MRDGELRFQALFDESLDAILLANDEGAYVDANPAACTLLGYERRELLGKTIADLSSVDESVDEAAFRTLWSSLEWDTDGDSYLSEDEYGTYDTDRDAHLSENEFGPYESRFDVDM